LKMARMARMACWTPGRHSSCAHKYCFHNGNDPCLGWSSSSSVLDLQCTYNLGKIWNTSDDLDTHLPVGFQEEGKRGRLSLTPTNHPHPAHPPDSMFVLFITHLSPGIWRGALWRCQMEQNRCTTGPILGRAFKIRESMF